jgi:hypothetical protein
MTWASRLLGCSGLVIEVGLENDGLMRSTRLPVGASCRQPLGRQPQRVLALRDLGLRGGGRGAESGEAFLRYKEALRPLVEADSVLFGNCVPVKVLGYRVPG